MHFLKTGVPDSSVRCVPNRTSRARTGRKQMKIGRRKDVELCRSALNQTSNFEATLGGIRAVNSSKFPHSIASDSVGKKSAGSRGHLAEKNGRAFC